MHKPLVPMYIAHQGMEFKPMADPIQVPLAASMKGASSSFSLRGSSFKGGRGLVYRKKTRRIRKNRNTRKFRRSYIGGFTRSLTRS